MDPEANAIEQRKLAAEILRDIETRDVDEDTAIDLDRLCDLIVAQQGWIEKGGFVPEGFRPFQPEVQLAHVQTAYKSSEIRSWSEQGVWITTNAATIRVLCTFALISTAGV